LIKRNVILFLIITVNRLRPAVHAGRWDGRSLTFVWGTSLEEVASAGELSSLGQRATLAPTQCCPMKTTRRIPTCRCFLPSHCQCLVQSIIL